MGKSAAKPNVSKLLASIESASLTDATRESLIEQIRAFQVKPVAVKTAKKGLRAITGYTSLEPMPCNPANQQRRVTVEIDGDTLDEITGLEWSYIIENQVQHPIVGWRFPKDDPKAADTCACCPRPLSFGRLMFIGRPDCTYGLAHFGCAQSFMDRGHPANVIDLKPALKVKAKRDKQVKTEVAA
jgi:hypothetical protein